MAAREREERGSSCRRLERQLRTRWNARVAPTIGRRTGDVAGCRRLAWPRRRGKRTTAAGERSGGGTRRGGRSATDRRARRSRTAGVGAPVCWCCIGSGCATKKNEDGDDGDIVAFAT